MEGSQGQRFGRALLAPVGVTVMVFALGITPLIIGGLIFTGLICVAALLWRMS